MRPPLGPTMTCLQPCTSTCPSWAPPRLLPLSCAAEVFPGPRPPWPSHLSEGSMLPDSQQPGQDLPVLETLHPGTFCFLKHKVFCRKRLPKSKAPSQTCSEANLQSSLKILPSSHRPSRQPAEALPATRGECTVRAHCPAV